MSSRIVLAALILAVWPGGGFQVAAQTAPAASASSPADSSPPAFVPDEVLLKLWEELNLENRRYLVYLSARLKRTALASHLAERILSEHPSDKQTLLILVSMHLERKNADAALVLARRLMEFYPNDEQARYHMAAAHYLAGQFQHARDLLRDLKSDQFAKREFPYQGDLASAAYLSGDWYRAMLAYQELLRRPHLDVAFRRSIIEVMDLIYRLHRPQTSAGADGFFLDSGQYWRTQLQHRQPLTEKQNLLFRWDHESIFIKERPLLRERSTDRNDLLVGLENHFNPEWTASLSLGGSESGWNGLGTVTRKFGEEKSLKLELAARQPSPDGLLLQSLDGRRNRMTLSGEILWHRAWFASGEIFAWESQVDETRLGRGIGGSWNFEHILLLNRPNFRVGYRGMYMRFARDSQDLRLIDPAAAPNLTPADRFQLLESLSIQEFHRHGLYTSWQDQLSGTLSYQLMAGVDYSIDRASIEQHASGGLTWRPIPRIELKSDLAYTSSARTADQASQLWQINIALKYWF